MSVLQVRGLFKRFGGLVATNNLDLDLEDGELHALIGPNGAGKSTAIGQLAGEIRPDAGSIRLHGAEIAGLKAHRRVRLGMTRSFQVTSVLPQFSAVENVMAVGAVRAGLGMWRDVRRDAALRRDAMAMLDRMGLAGRADMPAEDLAHGEQRQLELGMALATGARVLLLDEPMAGLGQTESLAMTATLARLKGQYSILLVEHDMQAVFALADRVTVLVAGAAIATGTPEAIRGDAGVRAAYLGEETC